MTSVGSVIVVVLIVLMSVLLCIAFGLAGLYFRRKYLARSGEVIDVDLRCVGDGSGSAWTTGMAVYHGNELWWYRTFAISTGPSRVFNRHTWSAAGFQEPEPEDMVNLAPGARVVKLFPHDPEGHHVELVLDLGAATGLLSWFESAPPPEDEFVF